MFAGQPRKSSFLSRQSKRFTHNRGDAAITGAVLEALESRKLMSVVITGTVTLDESPGNQVGGVAVGDEDNNDNDVASTSLPTALSNRLFGVGGLGLSSTFASQIGVGQSAANYITVTDPGTITSLGFTKADGTALPVNGGATPGVASGISAVTGGAISLFADAVLGNRLVIGKDTAGDVACVLFMEPNATLTSAKVWTVEFEPLLNPVTTNFDDPITMAGLGVAAGVSTEFNFNALPSGQNLFGTVGSTSTGLVVIGKTPVLNADGTFTNASNTINTSQGGGPTTIGINNQMFDAGDGGYFTFIKNPDPNFLAGAPNGLDQGEADDADNIVFQKRLEANGGFVKIAQIQGNSAATLKITLFNGGDSDAVNNNDDQRVFTDTGLGQGTKPAITKIVVTNAAGQIVQTINNPTADASGAVTVSGLGANFKVAWETAPTAAGLHDQVLIQGVAGKFDIGGFGVNEPTSAATPLTGVRFEDDGPAVEGTTQLLPPLIVDESNLATNDTEDVDDFVDFDDAFGQDGPGPNTTFAYAFDAPASASGLVDTASNQAVVLSLTSGVIEGRTATSNALVFTLSVNTTTGVVTLDQLRAVVHPTADPDESISPTATINLKVTATTKDGDGDTTTATVKENVAVVFKDDGPSIIGTLVGAPTPTVDESDLGTNDTEAFAGQFTPVFGADGQGAVPRSYALSTPGGNSGLVDTATGQAVNLSLSAGGVVEGRTATSNVLVFTVSVDANGNVTLDQIRSIVHTDSNDHDSSKTLLAANLVVLTGRAHDKDGDTASATLNIGQLLAFEDDGPGIGPIANSIVDFIAGSTVTKTLNGVIGADPNTGTRYTIDSFTTSVTVNGVTIQGVASANNTIVTYYADTGGNGTFGDAGDTAFYRLTLNQTGAGTYTFDVLVNPPPANLEFNFDDLPSGQNLFGIVGDTSNALVVIGKVPVLNADGTFTNASNTINTSQGGGGVTIGVNNQMFDPGEGAFFTYIKTPNPNFLSGAPNGLDQNEADDADNILYTGGTLASTTASTTISQTQGNALASMKITAFDISGSPQGTSFVSGLNGGTPVTITSVKVNGVAVSFTVSGNGVIVTGLEAGDKVEWTTNAVHDRALIECVAGKFDIGAFEVLLPAPTPDKILNFVARATDGDGDFATAGFSIGIDGTGIFDDGIVTGVSVSSLSSSLFSSASIDELAALLA